jgi:hypothetical protein
MIIQHTDIQSRKMRYLDGVVSCFSFTPGIIVCILDGFREVVEEREEIDLASVCRIINGWLSYYQEI